MHGFLAADRLFFLKIFAFPLDFGRFSTFKEGYEYLRASILFPRKVLRRKMRPRGSRGESIGPAAGERASER